MPATTPPRRPTPRRSPARAVGGPVEQLEDRTTPAIAMTLAGATATITGDGASDTLVVTVDTATAGGPFLAHNRATAGDPGFVNALDFDSTAAGVQTLPAAAASALDINGLGDGDDALRIVRGADGVTGSGDVNATVNVNDLGADAGDSITVDDGTRTAAAAYTYSTLALAFTGPGYNVELRAFHSGGFFLTTGTGADTVNVNGTFDISQEVVLNSAGGADTANVSGVTPGSLAGLGSDVVIRNSPSFTAVTIDGSTDPAARTATLDTATLPAFPGQTFGRLTTSAGDGGIYYAIAGTRDVSDVNINFGPGPTTLAINQTAAASNGFTTDITLGGAADSVNVQATSALVTTTIDAGGGADVIAVGNAGAVGAPGLLTPVAGPVVVNGQADGASLVVDGSGAAVAADYTVTATAVTRTTPPGFGGVTYSGLNTLLLTVGDGANVVTVAGTAAGVPTTVNTNDGADRIALAAGVSLNGGTVDGGAGTDTLDYAAYATPVAVNLGVGVDGLAATLDGGQQVPSNGSPATGTATINNYNTATRTFDLTLTVAGIAPAAVTGLHLHRGGLGVNGPIILDLLALGTLVPAGTGFTLTLPGLDVDNFLLGGAANEAAFLGGQTYLNVHTAAFPAGAVRGQLFSIGNVGIINGTATGTGGVSNVENATGGAAADSLVGSFLANVLNGSGGNDTILGGPGADTFLGGANDDVLIWSNGDGSDVMDGELGTDTVAVNGNLTLDDVFTIGSTNARIDFARTSPGPFSLDIGTAEVLRAAGVGGNDSFTFLGGVTAPFEAIQLFGLAGTDTFAVAPSGMPVSVFGGGGADTLDTDTTGATDTFLTSVADPAGGVMGGLTFTNRAGINFSQIELPPDPINYLTVTATDGRTTAAAGSPVTITVVVTNNSPIGLGGVGVSDLFPPELTGVTWTAAYTGSRSSGAASGSGDIAELVNLAAGGSVTYTVTARLRTDVVGAYTNTATASVPAGLVEANPADNTATDSTDITAALPPAPVVTGPGGGSGLRFSSAGGQLVSPQTVAFFPGFGGEVHVAQGDVDGDGVFDTVAATGPGAGVFQVVRGSNGAAVTQIEPFPGYAGGLFVAVGDLTGDGKADIAVMPDALDAFTGPINRELPVRVYSGADFTLLAAFNGLADLQGRSGENDGTRLGGRPAIADVNGDGTPDLLVAAGNGGGPRVTVWSGAGFPGAAGGKPTVNPITNLFVFESSQRGGAFVAAGDVSGDGVADIIVGGGPGGGPRVRIVNGAQLFGLANLDVNLDDPANLANGLVLNNFIAGDGNLRGGLRVAVADADADGRADLVTGSGTGERSAVRVYTGVALAAAFGTSSEPGVNQVLDPFGAAVPGGVWVG